MNSALASIVLGLVPLAVDAQPRTFEFGGTGNGGVRFRSEAPLETIEGTSNAIDGEVIVDPNQLAAARGRLIVPVRSIRTGEPTRDEHLAGADWLDSERYPNIEFRLTEVLGASSLTQGTAADVTLVGVLKIHGEEKPVRASGRVLWTGDSVRVRADFKVQLSDFNVSILPPARAKVSNEITVSINAQARAS
ncbi:MAG: YceI family protein [Myxococcota bacterium]